MGHWAHRGILGLLYTLRNTLVSLRNSSASSSSDTCIFFFHRLTRALTSLQFFTFVLNVNILLNTAGPSDFFPYITYFCGQRHLKGLALWRTLSVIY